MTTDTKKKRPGMGGRRRRPRPLLNRISTIWISTPTPPFQSAYQVGSQLGDYAVQCVSKSRCWRIDRSIQRRQALTLAMLGEIDIMRRLKHKYIISIEECYEDKHTLYIIFMSRK